MPDPIIPLRDDAFAIGVSPPRPVDGPLTWRTMDSGQATDVWFGAGRLVPALADHARTVDGPALAIACSMSDHAKHLSKQGPEQTLTAASLRAQAAERKRSAGAPEQAFTDYEALARHYLAAGALKPTIAYMRKALHVSQLPGGEQSRADGLTLAAEVYLAALQPRLALDKATAAATLAIEAGNAGLLEKASKLVATAQDEKGRHGGLCGCGKDKKFTACCGSADVVPVEFSAEFGTFAFERTPSPFRPSGWGAMETLMRPPDGAERSTWYAWRVEDGCYRLVAYANWSGRALKAGEAMVELAKGRNLPEATSSAVLQAFVALQSFMTTWKAHMRRSTGNRHWPEPVDAKRKSKGGHDDGDDFVAKWAYAGRSAFGETWSLPDRDDFKALARIRNSLCHHVAATETVLPEMLKDEDRQVIACLSSRGLKIGPGPAPMIDRIMVEGVAAWAVHVAKLQISAIQDAWTLPYRERELCEWRDGLPDDEAEDADEPYDDPLLDDIEELAAPAQASSSALLDAGTGLRRIAAERRCVIAAEEDDERST